MEIFNDSGRFRKYLSYIAPSSMSSGQIKDCERPPLLLREQINIPRDGPSSAAGFTGYSESNESASSAYAGHFFHLTQRTTGGTMIKMPPEEAFSFDDVLLL
ncbi:MAG TPA: hypothetical protein VLT88_09520, partial [Desulfosarcina sp.]|nr:hypothetical protein [Desulfosarcina sp.]